MKDKLLDQSEKLKLTDYAREVVARAARARVDATTTEVAVPVDAFSPEGLRLRLAALEKDFEALDRKVEQTVSTILTTLQRIEARASQTAGELRAVREDIDARAGDAAYARAEDVAAAKDYGAALEGAITRLVERLDAMNEPAAPKSSSATSLSRTLAAGRDGSGASRDG